MWVGGLVAVAWLAGGWVKDGWLEVGWVAEFQKVKIFKILDHRQFKDM